MDFSLGAGPARFQQKVREFARQAIAPVAGELDRQDRCPPEIIDALAEHGLLGACVPIELGGAGEDYPSYVAALEEISGVWASLGAILTAHNSLVCGPILQFGDDAQKRSYLPRLSRDRQLGCYAFAEPAAGSDAGAIQTTASASGDGFVLNGRKTFVTNAGRASVAIVYASTDPARGRDGLSAFIVDTGTAGVSVGKIEDKLGLRSAQTAELIFRECAVPRANLLGGLHRGFDVAKAVVERGRIDVAAQAVGIAQACLDRSVAQAKARRQFGRPIAEFEAIQWMLADMATEIEAARLLTYRAALRCERHPPDGTLTLQAAMAKLYASETATRAAYHAVQIFGGHGYLKDFPVERYFRDARATTLFEETSEIERLVIERELARTGA
jgi:butyryl-CoA dehydrogenase